MTTTERDPGTAKSRSSSRSCHRYAGPGPTLDGTAKGPLGGTSNTSSVTIVRVVCPFLHVRPSAVYQVGSSVSVVVSLLKQGDVRKIYVEIPSYVMCTSFVVLTSQAGPGTVSHADGRVVGARSSCLSRRGGRDPGRLRSWSRVEILAPRVPHTGRHRHPQRHTRPSTTRGRTRRRTQHVRGNRPCRPPTRRHYLGPALSQRPSVRVQRPKTRRPTQRPPTHPGST